MRKEDAWQKQALTYGEIRQGNYRVVSLEDNHEWRISDFSIREEAIRYADDAASEYSEESGGIMAKVYNDNAEHIHTGRPYWSP